MTKLNLQREVIALCGDATKMRVRVLENGVLQLRPTNRVSGRRLPKGEVLVDIKRKGFYNQVEVAQEFAAGSVLQGNPSKHGWLSVITYPEGELRVERVIKVAA